MRNKLLVLNTISSLSLQIVTIICGFIVPRLIISHYGSEVNGLVNSVTQYLAIIGFLELGVGAVVQSSLYKPLADKDNIAISKIVVSAGIFFKKIAIILLVYIVVLIAVYPFLVKNDFDWIYTAFMIVVISISSFAQYYFGVVDRLLLRAAQEGYIQYSARMVTLILNTIACVLLINLDAPIHVVKLTTSIIYLARPVFLRWYVDKNYKINRNIIYVGEPIKQKWNGVAQHFSAVVLDSTAMIILTSFATLLDVSVFSVYWMVVSGVKHLGLAMTSGINSLLGDLWAKCEYIKLNEVFSWVEWSLHTSSIFLFGCTSVLIVPFVKIYTSGVSDVDYVRPWLGLILSLAHMGHCLRLPYNILILAAGHYKQTQSNYIYAAIGNLVISSILVLHFGVIGVAVGAVFALYYQTIWMAYYLSQNLIKWPIMNFWKQILIDILTLSIMGAVVHYIYFDASNYYDWIVLALKVVISFILVQTMINFVFYKDKVKLICHKINNVFYCVVKQIF